jgi:Helix-turn-helix domain
MLTLTTAKPQQRRSAAPPVRPTRSAGWSKLANSVVDQTMANLSGSALKVYLVLLRHADRHGVSFPSVGRISLKAGICIRTASNAINELEKHHMIHRKTGGSGFSNRYQIIANPGNPLPTPPAPTDKSCRPPGSPLPTLPATDCPPTIPIYSDPDKKRSLLRRDRKQKDPAIEAKLATISDERVAQLKQTVLAKLPPFTAAKLADKDARSSPILSALIAGELAMQDVTATAN